MIIERRSLTRRRSLEDLCQEAIDGFRAPIVEAARTSAVEDAVERALAAVLALPPEMHRRGFDTLRQAVCKKLGTGQGRAVRAPKTDTKAAAEVVFSKGRAVA
jgi:hypothetical protein